MQQLDSASASDAPVGVVVAVRPGLVTVRVEADFACPRCAAGRGCGAGLLANRADRLVEVASPRNLSLHVGQRVTLALDPARVLHAAWLAYGLPLATLLAATVMAGFLWPGSGSDAAVVGTALVAVSCAAWWARRRLRRGACANRFVPVLRRSGGRPLAG